METPSHFFQDHTYWKWDYFLDEDTCKQMTSQVVDAYNKKKYYNTNPKWFDSIAQINTKHIEKQGYTKQYKAIYGEYVKDLTPLIYEYYVNPSVIQLLSSVTKCPMYPVPAYKTVDQAIQIYTEPGDGANWHHDRSIFGKGRCFTFLTVIHNSSDQRLTVWTDKYGIEEIKWSVGKAVLIEKFKTFHSVTPLTTGQRILLTLTYSEVPYKPTILRPIQYFQNKTKNFAYLGFDSFVTVDWIALIITIIISIVLIYILIMRIQILLKQSKKPSNKHNTNRNLHR